MRDREFWRWYKTTNIYRRFLIPHKIDRDSIVRSLYKVRSYARGVLLDLGARNKPYYEIFQEETSKYVALDIDPHSQVDVYGDCLALPFKDNSFDTILMTQVLNDVYHIEKAVSEIKRVLRRRGCLILTESQSTGLHDVPHDYFRFSKFALAKLMARVGLKVELLEPRCGTLAMIGETMSSFIYYTFWKYRWGHLLVKLSCLMVQGFFWRLDNLWFDAGNTLGYILVARKT